MEQDTTIQGLVTCFIVCFACRRLNPAGGEPAVQRGAGQSDAHWTAHGEGCQLQELQQQTGLDLRICHRGQSAVQGGPSHPGEGAGAGERGLWGARPVRQLMSPRAGSTRPRPSPSPSLSSSPASMLHTNTCRLSGQWSVGFTPTTHPSPCLWPMTFDLCWLEDWFAGSILAE